MIPFKYIKNTNLAVSGVMAMLSLTALAAEEKTAIAPPLADPHIAVFGTTFCLYPTTDMKGWNPTAFHGWTSKNLKHWKGEGVILDILPEVKWATGQAWAPAIATKNGKNYLNDVMISFDHQALKRLNRKATMKASLALSGMASIISVGVSMMLAIYANQLSIRHPSHAGDHQEVRILPRKTSIALQRLNHKLRRKRLGISLEFSLHRVTSCPSSSHV